MEDDTDIYLDYGLVLEILVKMPTYHVFRCQCICKRWNSIIREPSFAPIYVSRITNASNFSPHFLILIDAQITNIRIGVREFRPPPADSELHRLTRDELPFMVEEREDQVQPFSTGTLIYLPPTSVKQFNAKLLAASSGLFLLCKSDLYYIYNFLTGETVAIPPPSNYMVSPFFVGLITQMEGHLVERFRIVQIRKQGIVLLFRVYSSENATWTEQEFTTDDNVGCWDAKTHFAFKGHLHWVDCRSGIIAYDPFNNHFRLLKFPNSRSLNDREVCFSVSKGHIRLVETPQEAVLAQANWICEVWRLENYDEEEWCMEHRITHDWSPLCITTPRDFIPLLCHPNNPEVVYLWHSTVGQAISLNLRTGKPCVDNNWHPFHNEFMIKVVLPVEIPIWPSPIPRASLWSS